MEFETMVMADISAHGTGRFPGAAAWAGSLAQALPGIGLSGAVAVAAYGGALGQMRVWGHAPVEPLVLAILLGGAVRAVWSPGAPWRPGVVISAHFLLEIAVALLGASVSLSALGGAGGRLLLAIALVVVAALGAGYGVARCCGLRPRLALLMACGNAICGNSAIAAVAPVIGAAASEVASSIAFTAMLGVVVALGLPVAAVLLGLSPMRGGVLAGLTVYAVPQVLAAAAPLGAAALQIGTLVKLVRVLALGPVVLGLSLLVAVRRGERGGIVTSRLVPWFIVAFLALAAANSAHVLPAGFRGVAAQAAGVLTVISMAALGLMVDFAALRRVGLRAGAAATLALAVLVGLASLAIALLHIA